MSKKTIYLLGIALTIGVGTVLYCCLTDLCDCFFDNSSEAVTTGNNPSTKNDQNITEDNTKTNEDVFVLGTQNPFEIEDTDGDFNVKSADNFKFDVSTFELSDSIPQTLKDGVLKLKDYLLENPSKQVIISGFYSSDENNSSAFPNLGLARANTIKNALAALGVPVKQLNNEGTLNDDFKADSNGSLFGPLAFNMLTVSDEDNTSEMDALKTLCDGIKDTPLHLYFNYGEASITLSDTQRQTFADISKCIDKLGVKAQVEGHTDSESSTEFNLKLGQKRADFAKAYLVNNGILESNIIATSKGESEPIATNSTEEGKAKNRRTVITITN